MMPNQERSLHSNQNDIEIKEQANTYKVRKKEKTETSQTLNFVVLVCKKSFKLSTDIFTKHFTPHFALTKSWQKRKGKEKKFTKEFC